jgi:hypothetical protein
MMTATMLPSVERLSGYLSVCGGSDRFEFHDGFGEPDPIAARAFAEQMRDRCGDQMVVRQQAHRVVVSLPG